MSMVSNQTGPTGRLIKLTESHSESMMETIMTEKLKPIERIALIKMISLKLDATASILSENVNDPKDLRLISIILGV